MSDLLDFAGRPIPKKPDIGVIVFDLDGTLADHRPRAHHLTDDNSGWEAYFAELDDDEPISGTGAIFNMLVTQCQVLGHIIQDQKLEAQYPFVDILTGRPERFRERTLAWLKKNELLMPRALHMRPDGDHRPDNILKIEMYQQIYEGKETVLAVFEDRERCVKAWREAGIACYQVAEGQF